MPGSRNDTIPKVTWSQIAKLAEGNPVVAVWAIVLWVSATHPRLVFAFFIIVFVRLTSPELFHSVIIVQTIHFIISTFKKVQN